MSDKVYEMDEGYKEILAHLVEAIKTRDEAVEILKFAPPENLSEGRKLIADLEKAIEEGEAALAKEYEAHQALCRKEEELHEWNKEAEKRMAMLYIYFKYRNPDKLEEMRAALLNNYTPEEEQAFYDRVAILEATKLEEILVREK